MSRRLPATHRAILKMHDDRYEVEVRQDRRGAWVIVSGRGQGWVIPKSGFRPSTISANAAWLLDITPIEPAEAAREAAEREAAAKADAESKARAAAELAPYDERAARLADRLRLGMELQGVTVKYEEQSLAVVVTTPEALDDLLIVRCASPVTRDFIRCGHLNMPTCPPSDPEWDRIFRLFNAISYAGKIAEAWLAQNPPPVKETSC